MLEKSKEYQQRLWEKNCTDTLLGTKKSKRRNYKSNPVLGGALTTAMDSEKSATESSIEYYRVHI